MRSMTTLDRLHALIKVGYEVDVGSIRETSSRSDSSRTSTDLVHLCHPSRFEYDWLILFGDGLLENLELLNQRPENAFCIEPDDDQAFLEFLKTVPVPNWEDKKENENLIIFGIILIIIALIVGVGSLVDYLLH